MGRICRRVGWVGVLVEIFGILGERVWEGCRYFFFIIVLGLMGWWGGEGWLMEGRF